MRQKTFKKVSTFGSVLRVLKYGQKKFQKSPHFCSQFLNKEVDTQKKTKKRKVQKLWKNW